MRSASLGELLLTAAFYGVTGFALVAASCWYVNSLYNTLTGRGEVVIAPFELVHQDGAVDKSRGVALAHMLQAQLVEIERDLDSAQAQLVGAPPKAAASPDALPSTTPQDSIPLTAPIPIPIILTQGVGLRTRLLDPAEIKVSVAGVEVGGIVSWLQRQLVQRRTVVFTVYERQGGMRVTGSVVALGLRDAALAVDIRPRQGETMVPLDRVVERVAYEVVQRRLALDPNNRVEALDAAEFENLVRVLHEAGRLNRLVARGHIAPHDFQDLLPTARGLAESVEGWYQLSYLAASIAESAQDWPAAEKLYQRSIDSLPDDAQPALRAALAGKLAEARQKRGAEGEAEALARTPTGPTADALHTMQANVDRATGYFNELLGHHLDPAPVKLQTDPVLKYSPYYDSHNVVAAAEVQNLPDLIFRNAAWPQLMHLVGEEAIGPYDSFTDILYSYADILTMLAHQHFLKQDEKSSDWALGKGYVEWVKGQLPSRPYEGTPYLSFEKPGEAYDDPQIGKDRQVGHMRNFMRSTSSQERRYVNAGILNRAFYLAARATTTRRAAEIWIGALRQLKADKRIDFLQFAKILIAQAGDDAPAVLEALRQVGLDPTAPAERAQ